MQVSPAHRELTSNYATGFAVVAFRLPGVDSADYPALRVLAEIIDSPGGKLAELAMNGTVLGTSFDRYAAPVASTGFTSAAFAPGEDGHQLLALLKETIVGYAQKGIPADLVERAKRRLISGHEFRSTSIEAQSANWSDALVLHQTSSPAVLHKTLKSVTVDNVNRVAKKYLKSDQMITAIMTPEPSGRPTTMENIRRVRDSFTPEGVTPVDLPTWAAELATANVPTRTGDKPVDVRLKNGVRVIVRPDKSGG